MQFTNSDEDDVPTLDDGELDNPHRRDMPPPTAASDEVDNSNNALAMTHPSFADFYDHARPVSALCRSCYYMKFPDKKRPPEDRPLQCMCARGREAPFWDSFCLYPPAVGYCFTRFWHVLGAVNLSSYLPEALSLVQLDTKQYNTIFIKRLRAHMRTCVSREPLSRAITVVRMSKPQGVTLCGGTGIWIASLDPDFELALDTLNGCYFVALGSLWHTLLPALQEFMEPMPLYLVRFWHDYGPHRVPS